MYATFDFRVETKREKRREAKNLKAVIMKRLLLHRSNRVFRYRLLFSFLFPGLAECGRLLTYFYSELNPQLSVTNGVSLL